MVAILQTRTTSVPRRPEARQQAARQGRILPLTHRATLPKAVLPRVPTRVDLTLLRRSLRTTLPLPQRRVLPTADLTRRHLR